MAKWYYLVNTINSLGSGHIGHLISRHKSLDAAVEADRKIQRAVKRHNGQSSYIPTAIRTSEDVDVDQYRDVYSK